MRIRRKAHGASFSILCAATVALLSAPVSAETLDAAAINGAGIDGGVADGPTPTMIKLQVLLDRAGISPGVIDGYKGDNVAKALQAFEAREGLEPDGALDEEVWAILTADGSEVAQTYTITEDDLSVSFVEPTPQDYKAMSEMERVVYQTPLEMFAERFHMDQDLLEGLNPEADFGAAGTEILVVDTGDYLSGTAAQITADKTKAALEVYDGEGRLIAFYPATIGSSETPSPSGDHAVRAVAPDAAYYYNPSVNFKQGDNAEPLEIPPGPNNPVGGIWIDLDKETYGIHGTPDPASVSKTASHGCVRLTNWDAAELAGLVSAGVPISFVE
ncbi:MAG: L,D-transpeptidase [Pseudomonadota bacterium]